MSLINREDLIAEYDRVHVGAPGGARKLMVDAPEVKPEPKWIPCSERLPSPLEWDEKYLVSLAWGGIGVMEYKSTGFHNYGSFNPVPIETVIAWMPLPEPYKERRTDERQT